MSGRKLNLAALLVFLLTVPAGVYFFFTSPSMGFPRSIAGIAAVVLAFVGLALVPITLRDKPSASADGNSLTTKAGWVILIGFLIIMGAVAAYFMLAGR